MKVLRRTRIWRWCAYHGGISAKPGVEVYDGYPQGGQTWCCIDCLLKAGRIEGRIVPSDEEQIRLTY